MPCVKIISGVSMLIFLRLETSLLALKTGYWSLVLPYCIPNKLKESSVF
jgi:hypothetical protein